jgi:hypothetical protein
MLGVVVNIRTAVVHDRIVGPLIFLVIDAALPAHGIILLGDCAWLRMYILRHVRE